MKKLYGTSAEVILLNSEWKTIWSLVFSDFEQSTLRLFVSNSFVYEYQKEDSVSIRLNLIGRILKVLSTVNWISLPLRGKKVSDDVDRVNV